MRDRGLLLAIGIAMLVLTLGCDGPYRGTYLDMQHGHRFLACPSEDIEDPKEHAFNALLASLADNNWVIEESSREKKTLTARVCKQYPGAPGDYLKRADDTCASILFMVSKKNADVLAANEPDKRFYSSFTYYIERYMRALDRTYAELRCYSKEELARRTPRGSAE